MRLVIACYGRLGRLLIDERAEEGFHTYIQFTTDVIGGVNFSYPELDQDYSKEALQIWNELQEIDRGLSESKLKTLFLVAAKAIDKRIYSLVYSFVKEMATEHPRVININKKQLFRILQGDMLERFWIDSSSTTGTGVSNIFGLLDFPINAISKCYLILRSYSIFKGVEPGKVMTFTIPKDNDKKRDLYYLIESFKLNKPFLDDAYADLVSDKSSWEELYKGKFMAFLQETWSLINERVGGFEQIQNEIKASLPLDEEKVRGFREALTDSFLDFRKHNSWIDYVFESFPQDMENRKSYERVARLSLVPRDMFIYGLNVMGNFVAGDLGRELAQLEINGIIGVVGGLAERRRSEDPFSQEGLIEALALTPLGSQDLAILMNGKDRMEVSHWPFFRGTLLGSQPEFRLNYGGIEYLYRLFFYHQAIAPNEVIVLPLNALEVVSENFPLVAISEKIRFSAYKEDNFEKVEFIMELIVKSVVLKDEYKAVMITFGTTPKDDQ
jgi:hypothetical protein